MKFDLHTPCKNCPFVRGGIHLRPDRAEEIAEMMLDSQGGTFPCHKTLNYDYGSEYDDEDAGRGEETENTKHCAGALIFAEKNETATQMMRIMERVRAYDPMTLMSSKNQANIDRVFDDIDEMVQAMEEQE